MTEWLSSGLFLAGALLALLASVGVLRMPDVLTRMQASTKASTLGLGCLLLGLAIRTPELSVVIRVRTSGIRSTPTLARRASSAPAMNNPLDNHSVTIGSAR